MMERRQWNGSLEYNELFHDIQEFLANHSKWKDYDITVAFSEGTVLPCGNDLSLYDEGIFPLYIPEITLYSMPPVQKIYR